MTEEERAALVRGFYGDRKDTEQLMDEIDCLLAGLDEDLANRIMQACYRLAEVK